MWIVVTNPAGPAASDAPERLLVRTRPVEVDDLLALLPERDFLAWVHDGDGIVGWGRAASFDVTGPDRFAAASRWWDELRHQAVVRDEIEAAGSGLVAFGTFDFAADGAGHLTVPEVVVGRRDGRAWVSTIGSAIGPAPELRPTRRPDRPGPVTFDDGDVAAWTATVAAAVERIEADQLDKVVLARDCRADFERPLDVRWPLTRLARDYPACWTFHVDGFFGSTPEMLLRLDSGLVTSRVLAGTIRRTGDDAHDAALAGSLARSSKDLEEHEYAVRSVSDALQAHCSAVTRSEAPFVLHLPNVMHLATDIAGVVPDGTSVLSVVADLHPSAAVGGTPTAEAVRLIAQIEGLDRGRYAGPVGWIDGHGDGEWGIGLRSAELAPDGRSARLFAGCGIVADSVPADELAESEAKLIPVRTALSPRD
ncbi:chorismate-binding protein [Aeromicrobium alkaliterrae]|uniref:isochorismate synthase n=1 Tax=Aeromicrobium alkaliterrae TaxID=302168 RepID=A0ABN2JVX8_9ACTN